MSNTDKFVWTDELAIDFAIQWARDRKIPSVSLELFKQSKEQVEEKRIEVSAIRPIFSFSGCGYDFYTSSKIQPEKYEAVKQAIERELNGENANPAPPTPEPKDSKEDKGWEIITFTSIHGEVLELDEHKWKYRSATSSISDINFLLKHYIIQSVRRTSDGEVFTVGDKVIYNTPTSKGSATINGFQVENNKMWAMGRNLGIATIDLLEKSEQPKEEPKPPIDYCGICGGKLCYIRGRYPDHDKRKVCPTCTTEKLEQISEIADKNYGHTSQSIS